MVTKIQNKSPQLHETCFIHRSAVVSGNVVVGANSSIWPCAALRGDSDSITIGKNTSIQDNCVVHSDAGLPTTIGDNVVVGHSVTLHSCTVGNNSLIGIGSIVLNGASIGNNSIVAAGSLVTPGKHFPDGVMLMGSPAKIVRELNQEEIDGIQRNVGVYVKEAQVYKETEQEI